MKISSIIALRVIIWFLKTDSMTTSQLNNLYFSADSDEENISHVLMQFENYTGWYDKDLWEWLDVR